MQITLQFLVKDKCLSNIETVLQNELEIVSEWLVDNKLSLHLGKTESILFGSRPRLKSQSVLSIICKGTVIEAKNTVKYLTRKCDNHNVFLVLIWRLQ